MKEEIKKLLRSIIYILMGLQLVWGIVWICCNLGEITRFEESTELLTMSKTLRIDEYTGVLYPMCIRVLMTLGEWIELPGCAFLYVLQIAAAYLAYEFFLKRVVFHKAEIDLQLRIKIHFLTGFIITIPTVLQCHMAILPYSLASSAFIVLLADTAALWRRGCSLTVGHVIRIGLMWVISSLICPDYGWLAGIAVGISVVRCMVLQKKAAVNLLVMLLVSALCVGILNTSFQTEGSTGKIQKSVGAAMVLRFVWPNFSTFQYFWSPEVSALWDSRELADLAMYPEKVIYEFGPALEQECGKDRANEIYREMAGTAFSLDTKNILLAIAADAAAYICPPLTMYLQLHGAGVSYTGWNYGRMKDYAPLLTKYYVDYALSAWVCILVLCAALFVLSLKKKNESVSGRPSVKKERIGVYLCSISILVNLWYVMMSGSMQDYKKVIVNSILWAFLMVKILEDKTGQHS